MSGERAAASEHAFPVPVFDDDTAPFWDAARLRRLVVPRCGSCGHWVWQPKPICPRCRHRELTWTAVSGEAHVVSWTTLHPPLLPAFAPHAPFVVLLVELADAPGVRMVGQLVDDAGGLLTTSTDGADEGVHTGAALTLCWREQGDVVLPAWVAAHHDGKI